MLTVGIVMGGVSPEHEVSVISSLQAAHALDRQQYRPVPIYIAKDGAWYTGDVLMDTEAYQDLDALRKQATPVWLDGSRYRQLVLRPAHTSRWSAPPTPIVIDVLLLGLHGGPGEDGSLQGLCEAFNVPYTGSGVFGSALGMDKVLSKMLCRDQDIPVVDFVAFRESEWGGEEEAWMDRVEEQLGYPVIVKPARLGSSIGIAKADDRAELDHAIEDAFRYDEKVVVEQAVQNLREINCSVLGDPQDAIASVLEQPIPTDTEEVLSFTDKYQRGGSGSKARGLKQGQGGDRGMASLDRLIPAPLSDEQTAYIRNLGVRIFQTFECAGVARIDFMIDDGTGQVYFNEINTIPGSFSFYLWEPTGIPFAELTHRLVQTALRRHEAKNGRVRTYDTNLLSERSLGGLKGKG
ncbi:MAG: D-alanine--D-alanine ligase family protein [Bacteroidota bacterium]